MKKIICSIICIVALFMTCHFPLFAADDDLSDLADETAAEEISESDADLDSDSEELSGVDEESVSEEPNMSVSFGGYVKALAYWNQEKYSDLMWEGFEFNKVLGLSAPSKQEMSGYNNLGSRLQLKVEGFLSDRARLFSAVTIDFNGATAIHDRDEDVSDQTQSGSVRVVESFIEIYEGSRTWKIGSQIVTWGYMEGMEVPTDRVNARDYSYKSTEYEDSKLPSTGLLLTQTIGGSRLELMVIPVARVNTSSQFMDYFFANEEERSEHTTENGKYAARFSSSLGNLDYALSYVDGIDPQPDVKDEIVDTPKVNPLTMTNKTIQPKKHYNRVQSPGLDLQYNFGSWLAKASAASYVTEDASGDCPDIKNNWSKVVVGVEVTFFDSTINLHVGQTSVENYPEDETLQRKSFYMGQIREQLNFVSGHLVAHFLPGDALNLVLMAASYQDKEGETIQTNTRASFKYKIADGLEVLIGAANTNVLETVLNDFQAEVKYAF